MPALSKADSAVERTKQAALHTAACDAAAALLAAQLEGADVGAEEARTVLRQPEVRFDSDKLADLLEKPSTRAVLLRALGLGADGKPSASAAPNCLRCGDEPDEGTCFQQLGLCGHSVLCGSCAGDWLSDVVGDSQLPPFACPVNMFQQRCPGVVSAGGVTYAAQHLRLKPHGPARLEKLAELTDQRRLLTDEITPDLLRCPRPACGALVRPSDSEASAFGGQAAKPSVTCHACRARFCRACSREPHFPLPCDLWVQFQLQAARLEDKPHTFEPLVARLVHALGNREPSAGALAAAAEAAMAQVAEEAAEAAEQAAAAATAAIEAEEAQLAKEDAAACAPPLPEHPAVDALSPEEAEQQSMAEIARITKVCPYCACAVARAGGCNTMRCWQCHRTFCWHCGGHAHNHGRGACGAELTAAAQAKWAAYDPSSEVADGRHGGGQAPNEAMRRTLRQRAAAEQHRARLIAASDDADVRAWIVEARAKAGRTSAPPQSLASALVADCLQHVRTASGHLRASREAQARGAATAAQHAESAAEVDAAVARAHTLLAFLHAHRFYEAASALRDTTVGCLLGAPPAAAVLADPTQRLLLDEEALGGALAALDAARPAAASAEQTAAVSGKLRAVVQQRRALELQLLAVLGGHLWLAQQVTARREREEGGRRERS